MPLFVVIALLSAILVDFSSLTKVISNVNHRFIIVT